MASLRMSISMDPVDSRKSNFSANLIQLPDQCPVSSITSCTHGARTCTNSSLFRVKHIKVFRFRNETNLVDGDVAWPRKTDVANGTMTVKHSTFGRESKKRSQGAAQGTNKDTSSKFSFRGHSCELEKDVFVDDGKLDVNYSVIKSDLSLEHCNAILKQLERCSDKNTLRFFEWMSNNGKLKGNLGAYNLVFRVLGRREDWNRLKALIREASNQLGCALNYQVFNTVIYECSKKQYVELAANWFRLMLEFGVQPNVATFGMLMGLYQKSWNLEEAEFAFAQMRTFRIVCQSAYSAMITIYTRMRLYDKAEEVIGIMGGDEVVLNLENWLVMLNAYSQQGKLEQAELVLVSMRQVGFSPNIVAYNTLITGYGKVSNMGAAQRLFQDLHDVGLDPDETTYRSMIEGWGRANNYKEAEWYYKELKRLGYKPNSSNLYTLINLQAKYGHKEGAIRAIDDMLNMGCQHSSILGTVLQAYEKVGQIDTVPLILNGSFHHHVLVNQTSCSMLVMAYVKNGLVNEAMKLLKEKEWKDLAFEANLYHLLICSCRESGNLDDAVKIYDQMADSDNKPNLYVTCTMIDIYSGMGQFTEAERLFLRLKSSGVPLDMIAFSIVVRMYMRAGLLKEACAVLAAMEKNKGIAPDIYLLRDMLRVYQRCGMLDKLSDLYYKILKSGITWDQEMYNCVINCCARALPVDELSRIFDEMLHCGFTPNTITFNVMLDVYGKAKLFKKVKKLFLMAKKLGLVDIISYNTVIAAYGQNKDLKNMSSTVQKMEFDGFSVSLEAYNCMLDAYGKDCQLESFKSVLKRMKESSCASDHYTYNIMINIYGEQGWIDEVAGVLTELRECGPGPDLCSYNTLIKAYGIAGLVEDAVGLMKEMRQKGIEPDKITYINLINALRKNDKFLEAVKWSLWMKQMGL